MADVVHPNIPATVVIGEGDAKGAATNQDREQGFTSDLDWLLVVRGLAISVFGPSGLWVDRSRF